LGLLQSQIQAISTGYGPSFSRQQELLKGTLKISCSGLNAYPANKRPKNKCPLHLFLKR
jgi:hypothetical protein